ncbi:amidohydrolase family protein [Variovorax paradoxus]|uniref:Amidohydrolase family protein n=1 Tax=Variovorax paradoxus TaxID=34073 RepID=A0A5Q0M6R4_VARPD|nr:amidohydrolase family protein [Variovorax paradoxus]QFZ85179.1 amidohydrolase family protein [Variovorax paradoxus]
MSTNNYLVVREDWLALHEEQILEPSLRIVDAHHHFYDRPGWIYLDHEYLADARSGHNVVASVYMQAQTRYRPDGPRALQPVGETEYVAAVAQKHASGIPEAAKGIVGHVDLRLGAEVREVLEAHIQVGQGRFKGVRHLTTWDPDSSLVNPLSATPRGLLLDKAYGQGVAQLSELQLSYDAWLFFHQLPELFELARSVPHTPVVINHCGGILRIAAYEALRAQVFDTWLHSMRQLAKLPNVYVKLGGLGMRINGFDFEKRERPPSSDQLAQTWKPWMEPCIEAFGADRCMFESNFPVDKGSYSYTACWNAFKRLTSGASAEERQALFEGTATRVYRLAQS